MHAERELFPMQGRACPLQIGAALLGPQFPRLPAGQPMRAGHYQVRAPCRGRYMQRWWDGRHSSVVGSYSRMPLPGVGPHSALCRGNSQRYLQNAADAMAVRRSYSRTALSRTGEVAVSMMPNHGVCNGRRGTARSPSCALEIFAPTENRLVSAPLRSLGPWSDPR